MIYTVTFNPSIDYVVCLDKINFGVTNRTQSEDFYIGGKGINVSLVLSELDIKSIALGFTAGFTGAAIEARLAEKGIESKFIRLPKGNSRINIKIRSESETEINAEGPDIPMQCTEELVEYLNCMQNGDYLVLAGSVPKSLPDNIYGQILSRLSDRDIKCIADTTGNRLMNLMKYHPFLIKPNKQELEEIFGVTISSESDIEKYARRLKEMGAVNVLVSLGSDGAVLLDEFVNLHKISAIKCNTVNTVGAGDSMVAGFLAGYLKSFDYEYALKLGAVCGGATASLPWLASRDKIGEILKQMS